MSKSKKQQLEKIFQEADENSKTLAAGLIREYLFLEDTLQKLKEDIEVNGPALAMKNGNGLESFKENPALKAYNATMRSYATVIGSLKKLLPKMSEMKDDFDDF